MRKAVWGLGYDMHTDKCYQKPSCPDCNAPVLMHSDGKYKCISCGDEFELSKEMKEWFDVRLGVKVEVKDCFHCGGKGTLETHYIKNNVTREWIVSGGECKNCGMQFIV